MIEEGNYRVFVGGLAAEVQEEEVRDKFKSFGSASDVYLVHKKDNQGGILKTFGYLNLKTSEQQLRKCIALFGGTKWKGHSLKIQLARDDFMKRLRKEWESPDPVDISKSRKRKQIDPVKSYEEFVTKSKNLKKAIPGIPIEGEKNWVIGKYGRPLPIVHIPKPDRKLLKHDPSKHCHCIRKIADDDSIVVDASRLTWELEETVHLQDKVKTMKRKKKKTSDTMEISEKETPVEDQANSPDQKAEKTKPRKSLETGKRDASADKKAFENSSAEKLAIDEVNDDVQTSMYNGQRVISFDSESESDEKAVASNKIAKKYVSDDEDEIDEKAVSTNKSEIAKKYVSDDKDEEVTFKNDQVVFKKDKVVKEIAVVQEKVVSVGEEEESERDSESESEIEMVVSGEEKADGEEPVSQMEITMPNLASQFTSFVQASTPMTVHNKSIETGALSTSIVEQLKTVVAKGHDISSGHVASKDDGGISDNSDVDHFDKTNMFDFDFEKIDSTKKPDETALPLSVEKEKDVEESDAKEVEEEEVNMFDFDFPNLKRSGADFLQKMEFKWSNEDDENDDKENDSDSSSSDDEENEGDVGADSDKDVVKDRDTDKDGDRSSGEESESCDKEKTVNLKKENDTEENVNMFDFEFPNIKRSGSDFLQQMKFKWTNEDDENDSSGSSSSDEEANASVENGKENDSSSSSEERENSDQEKTENLKKKKKTEKGENEQDKEAIKSGNVTKKNQKESSQNKTEVLDKEQDTSSKKKEKATTPGTETNTIATPEPDESGKKEKKKKGKDKKKNSGETKHYKPELSEEARKNSVDARNQRTQEQSQQNKALIKNALRDLDTSKPSSNRICFSDDDDEDEEEEEVEQTTTKQKEKLDLLGDSEDSDNDDDDESATFGANKKKKDAVVDFLDDDMEKDDVDVDDDNRFTVKPQFQGKHGEKLFKMQLHYKGDERFRLDDRFAVNDRRDDNDDDSDCENQDSPKETEKIVGKESEENLKEEKDRNLSVLESILGKSLTHKKKQKMEQKIEDGSSAPYERYDPTKSDHSKLEIQEDKKKKKKKQKNLEMEDNEDGKVEPVKEVVEDVAPEVSKERFYEVDTSLKSLFGGAGEAATKTQDPPSTFTFLSSIDDKSPDDDDDVAMETENTNGDGMAVEEAKVIKEVSWKKGLSEGRDVTMKEDGDEPESGAQANVDPENNTEKKASGGFFFFTENDKRFDIGSSFKRTEQIDEITKQWENVRQSLHNDFKRKHKDAIRRVRKTKEKRRMTKP